MYIYMYVRTYIYTLSRIITEGYDGKIDMASRKMNMYDYNDLAHHEAWIHTYALWDRAPTWQCL